MTDIVVVISDHNRKQVTARLLDFQAISRVYPSQDGTPMKQEGIVLGICLTDDGSFYARRLHEMRAILSEEKENATV